ncbi:MAG TPA: ice-binding family protein [Ilumatobacteraceae bacterium]|nr:ice-binding family protein [Ilumatobacteraceae bacterium]
MSAHPQSHPTRSRRRGLPRLAAIVAIAAGTALALTAGQSATAQISPTGVPLGTAGGYSVLGGQTVTNTGSSVINRSVGLYPGTSITGFPPGIVTPPATIQGANAATLQAQVDLTTAYDIAAARPSTASVTNDLLGRGETRVAGVYTGDALDLTGALTLDGQNDPNAVFVFQAASTLVTASTSTITLINGANPCNVFWQVGSSATLGTGSVFVGTILAHVSVSVNDGVVVHGRALARTGSVTLINDVFSPLSCDSSAPATTTTTVAGGDTTLTTTPEGTPTVPAGVTVPASPVATDLLDGDRDIPTTSFVFTPTDVTLPATGTGSLVTQSGVGFGVLLIGLAALVVARRRQPA